MNLGKDSNNQSLDAFDDMTFDDMTFDDEPLQNNFQSNNIPNEDMVNVNQNYNEQNMTNIQVEMQQASEMNAQEPNMQSQISMQKGKVKKAKKEKAPKAPKTPKAPKQKKSKQQNTNQTNAMMLGNQPEEVLEKKKLNLKVIIPIIAFVVIALVLVIVLNLPKNTDKHITLATNTPVISNDTEVDNSVEVSPVGDSTADKDKDNNTEVVDNTQNESSATVLTLNNPMKIGVVVNTKLEGDTEYTDHESYLKIEYSNFVSGYDNVKVYLDEYNETATNKINLPDKDAFYESSVGNDLVMYEITVTVPDDFPTNDAKHGFTGLNPEFSFEIKGTEKEDALITKLYEFAIPSVYYIGSDTSEFTIGNTYTLRYMTTMPMELKAEGYKLTFIYSNDGKSERYGLQSLDIPSNKDVVEMTEETVEALTEETTETEVNDEEQKAE
jgi:hypothetical protein